MEDLRKLPTSLLIALIQVDKMELSEKSDKSGSRNHLSGTPSKSSFARNVVPDASM